jgi:phage shock protein A
LFLSYFSSFLFRLFAHFHQNPNQIIAEHIRDIKDKYSKAKALPADQKAEGLRKWFETELNEWLVKLEKSLPATRSPGMHT